MVEQKQIHLKLVYEARLLNLIGSFLIFNLNKWLVPFENLNIFQNLFEGKLFLLNFLKKVLIKLVRQFFMIVHQLFQNVFVVLF